MLYVGEEKTMIEVATGTVSELFCLQKRGDICNCNRPPSSQYISLLLFSCQKLLELRKDFKNSHFECH